MKSARNQFLVLGLVCLGFSSDDYWMPGMYLLAGIAALLLAPKVTFRPSQSAEGGIILAGGIFGYLWGRMPGQSAHFAIGHGLAWIQLARMLRPLNPREKTFSLIIALFHIGVACTVVLDIRFTFILPALLVLLPRTLKELAGEEFGGVAPATVPRLNPIWFLGLAVVMVSFFIVFPRGFLAAPLRAPRPGSTESGSLEDAVMDPTRVAAEQGNRVLLQIQGEHLGYLRCFSLVDTDGIRWTSAARPPLKRLPLRSREEMSRYPARRVRLNDPAFLGRIFPVDGQVVFLTGNFFQIPLQNAHGGIEALTMWNTVNNVYEYWIEPEPKVESLFRAQQRIYTNHPPQSVRLQNWLEERLRGETDPYRQARRLEGWFRANYTYKLGAPALSRLNPVEDFIFNQREGHCERFASALGLTLRMKGIPARVVVGYVPSSRDWFSGWINVRFRDAHAWTEAWFPDRGWVQLDATPAGTGGAPQRSLTDLLDDLDFAWYAQIANFDRPAQRQLFRDILKVAVEIPSWGLLHAGWIALVLSPGLLLLAWRYGKRLRWPTRPRPEPRRESRLLAENYYGKMLQALARHGLHRQPAQTPLEFLAELSRSPLPVVDDARSITEHFCATRYGGLLVTPMRREQIESALARIGALPRRERAIT